MVLDLEPLWRVHPHARVILTTLQRHGHDAALVGGAVRDVVRARLAGQGSAVPPELDLATAASPDQVQELFSAWKVLEVGQAFGVLVLVAPNGQRYEVASYRREGAYDGRRPGRVAPAALLEEDLARRDFTVNGLAARLDGRLVDPFGGLEDLKRRRIRTIGDPHRRLGEDFLRLLRAVRFACALFAEIAPQTAAAIRAHATGLKKISRERVRDELFKLLATPAARRGIELLDELGLLVEVLPEVSALRGVPQPERYHPEGDVYVHTLLALDWADRLRLPPLSKLAVLLHDVGKPQALEENAGAHMGGHEKVGEAIVRAAGRRLRLSAAQLKVLAYTTREHMRVAKLPEMGEAKRLRFLKAVEHPSEPFSLPRRAPRLVELARVLLCDAQASAHKSSAWLPVLRTTVDLLLKLRDLDALEAAHKLLDGKDVLALGVEPGLQVGQILRVVYDRIFAGEVNDRKGALRAARLEVERSKQVD